MRTTAEDAALRGYNTTVRGVIMAVDDTHAMQTIDARGVNNEYFQGIERPQQYGFNSVPVPPDENGGSAAEVVLGFKDGNRAHPFVISEGDRRTRPKNWMPGESGTWHYKGAFQKHTDNGFVKDAGPDKMPDTTTVGNDVVTIADGKYTAQVGGSGGPAVVVKVDLVYLGGDPDQGGTFAFVMTESGPSTKVKAKI